MYCLLFYGLTNKNHKPYNFNQDIYIEIFKVEPAIQLQIDKIKQNKEWLNQVKQNALNRGTNIPRMLEREANYIVRTSTNPLGIRLNNLINRIKQDSVWMKDIKQEALKKNVSEDEMILRSAKYIINKEKEDENN